MPGERPKDDSGRVLDTIVVSLDSSAETELALEKHAVKSAMHQLLTSLAEDFNYDQVTEILRELLQERKQFTLASNPPKVVTDRTSKWLACVRCSWPFTAASKSSTSKFVCNTHYGEFVANINSRVWLDYNEDINGPRDSARNKLTMTAGFIWTCCGHKGGWKHGCLNYLSHLTADESEGLATTSTASPSSTRSRGARSSSNWSTVRASTEESEAHGDGESTISVADSSYTSDDLSTVIHLTNDVSTAVPAARSVHHTRITTAATARRVSLHSAGPSNNGRSLIEAWITRADSEQNTADNSSTGTSTDQEKAAPIPDVGHGKRKPAAQSTDDNEWPSKRIRFKAINS